MKRKSVSVATLKPGDMFCTVNSNVVWLLVADIGDVPIQLEERGCWTAGFVVVGMNMVRQWRPHRLSTNHVDLIVVED